MGLGFAEISPSNWNQFTWSRDNHHVVPALAAPPPEVRTGSSVGDWLVRFEQD